MDYTTVIRFRADVANQTFPTKPTFWTTFQFTVFIKWSVDVVGSKSQTPDAVSLKTTVG